MNKPIALILVLALTYQGLCMDATQTQIDVVEQLLAELKGSTIKEIENLRLDYDSSFSQKQSVIAALTTSVKAQNGECNSRDNDVNNKVAAIKMTQDYLIYLNDRLAINSRRINKLRENRCDQNSNYIDGLKNQKVTLRLIQFLISALENARDGDFSLIQQNKMGHLVLEFLSIYKHAKQPQLIELTRQIEDTLNIKIDDNDLEMLQTHQSDRTLSGTKAELIQMLREMEAYVRSTIAEGQEYEVSVGIELAGYFGALDTENQQLTKMAGDELRNLVSMGEQLTTARRASSNCVSRLNQLKLSLSLTVQGSESATTLYNSQKSRLEEERGLFDDVYRIYATQVATTDDQFKAKVDNYINKNTLIQTDDQEIQQSIINAVREQASKQTQVQ